MTSHWKKLNRSEPASRPLPDKIAGVLHEARGVTLALFATFLGLALWGYHRADPGWSHSLQSNNLNNPAGRTGAWLSDLLLYVFGFSAWWWVVLLLAYVWRGYRRSAAPDKEDQRPLYIGLFGFVVLLIASSGLETLRFYSLKVQLPLENGAGGMLGIELSKASVHYFGYTGATLILLALFFLGWRIFTGMSWVGAAEAVGGVIEGLFLGTAQLFERWRDRRIGRSVAREREAVLKVERQRVEMQEPVFIETPEAVLSEPQIQTQTQAEPEREPEAPPSPLPTSAPLPERAPKSESSPERERQEPVLAPETAQEIPLETAPETVPETAPETAQEIAPEVIQEVVPVPKLVAGALLPPLELLEPAPALSNQTNPETLEYTSRLIEHKLADFGVKVKVTAAYPGPVITRYEFEPNVGVKGSQIVNLSKDLARALSLVSVRVVETIPEKSCMALELPNPKRQMVRLSEIISSPVYHDMASPLAMSLGKDISGLPVVVDLAKMPHLLVAGTTGSGKSVGINAMILSLLYKSEPDQVRLILIDPKMLELSIYSDIPHLLTPVVVDMEKAANALNWCVGEMEKRYKQMSAMGVRNLAGFNQRIKDMKQAGAQGASSLEQPLETLESLPHIVVIIDELADLMMVAGKKVEQLIVRLAQKARAAGIHLILATQRPSANVITGLIKANITTRIAFQVSSKIDSRIVLDQMGAEALLGQGDMLYLAAGTGYPTRVHGAFVADDEVHRVVDHLKKAGAANYVEGVLSGIVEKGGADSGREAPQHKEEDE